MKHPLTILGLALFSIFVFALCFFATLAITQGAEISTTITQSYFQDKDFEPARGVILEVKKVDLKVYLSFSYEEMLLRLCGQEVADISLTGIGIGFQYPYEFLTFSLGASYYFPNVSMKGLSAREGLWLEINRMYPEGAHASYLIPDVYTYELHGNIGAWIKVNASYPVSEHLSCHLGLGYRYLNLREHYVRDHRAYCPGSWVEFIEYRDLSGGFVSFGLTWRF